MDATANNHLLPLRGEYYMTIDSTDAAFVRALGDKVIQDWTYPVTFHEVNGMKWWTEYYSEFTSIALRKKCKALGLPHSHRHKDDLIKALVNYAQVQMLGIAVRQEK